MPDEGTLLMDAQTFILGAQGDSRRTVNICFGHSAVGTLSWVSPYSGSIVFACGTGNGVFAFSNIPYTIIQAGLVRDDTIAVHTSTDPFVVCRHRIEVGQTVYHYCSAAGHGNLVIAVDA